jgi:excisionase family DNA binding protein
MSRDSVYRDIMTLLTITEAAEFLKVHPTTIRNLIKRGELQSSKVGNIVRINEEDIVRMLDDAKRK